MNKGRFEETLDEMNHQEITDRTICSWYGIKSNGKHVRLTVEEVKDRTGPK